MMTKDISQDKIAKTGNELKAYNARKNWDLARLKGNAQQIIHLADKYKQKRIGVEIAKLAIKLEREIKNGK